MAVEILETVDSREANISYESPTREIRILIGYTFDEYAVRVLVQGNIPAFYDNLPLQGYTVKHAGNGLWNAVVSYARKEPRRPGMITVNFDVTADSQKVTHSLQSFYYPKPSGLTISGEAENDWGPGDIDDLTGLPVDNPPGEPPPAANKIDFAHAINVKDSGGKGKIEGVDIAIPKFKFTVTKIYGEPDFPLTTAEIINIAQKVGCVNSDAILVNIQGLQLFWAADNLLFAGATLGRGGDGLTEVMMTFDFNTNLFDVTIAGIPGVTKRGWDYVWVAYEDSEDTDSNTLIPKPIQVNVEQVYHRTTMSELFLLPQNIREIPGPVNPPPGEVWIPHPPP